MDQVQRAVDLFSQGMTCSQAMLTVFGEDNGLDGDLVTKLGRPLGGGMGRTGRTCGAVSAAVLLLGLATDDEDEAAAKKACFHDVQRLFQRFASLHGSAECRDLLGADWNTAEGLEKIQRENLVKIRCPAFVRDAASILQDLLLESRSSRADVAACCGR